MDINLQLVMNNFHINNLMSYTDIHNHLDKAFTNANPNSNKYYYAKRIKSMINDLDNKDDFVLGYKTQLEALFY